MRSSIDVLATAFLTIMLCATPPGRPLSAAEVPGLVFEQTVRGVPGMRAGETAKQRITVDLQGKRVLLEALVDALQPTNREGKPVGTPTGVVKLNGGDTNRVILRLDEKDPTIYEVDDAGKQYVKRSANLSRLQEERDLMEVSILEKVKKLPKAERTKILSDRFLRPDGKRVVTIREGPKRVILGRSCRQIQVTENGRIIIDAWVTPEIGGGATFYELYQGLGAFSKDVLDRLKTIHDFPLEATIKVVTAGPTYDISASCTLVRTDVSTKTDAFTVPKGYREIKKQSGIVPCPVCAKEMEWDQPGGGIHVNPLTKTEYRTCSTPCKRTMSARIQRSINEALKRQKGSSRVRQTPKTRSRGAIPRKEGEKATAP